MAINRQTIQQFPLFSALCDETIKQLAENAILRHYQSNEMIQIEGDPVIWVGFIQSGVARVYKLTAGGREQVLINLKPGMHFNSVPALKDGGMLEGSVRAISTLTIILIPVEPYRMFLQKYPDFTYVILQDFARRLEHLTDLVEELSLHSVRGRLARFLLEQADQDEVAAVWTQDELAAHLGTVRDVIGRTLRAFMDNGLIRREGVKLLLLDRKRLEEESLT